MKTLYFVHIPKTAGTSFRNAAAKYFGKDHVVFDYGSQAPETSDLVRECFYERRDHWSLYQKISSLNSKMLCGHFPAIRYMPGIGVENAVVFFREPIQRLVSEYRHFVRHKGFSGSFRDFYTQTHNVNALFRRVEGIPIEAFGALGLTERYDESLTVINARYQLELEPLVDNTGRDTIEELYEVDPEDYCELAELNRKDLELYQQVCELFAQRQTILEEGKSYAHARLATVKPKKVVGWAWWEIDADEAVDVDVRVNGQVVAEAQGKVFRPSLFRLAPPRAGYVEFTATIDAQPGDAVDCVVQKTGQVFPPKPVVVE